MKKTRSIAALPSTWEEALYTKERKFISTLECLHGHGVVRMAYSNNGKPHTPCAECNRLHSKGESFGSLPITKPRH